MTGERDGSNNALRTASEIMAEIHKISDRRLQMWKNASWGRAGEGMTDLELLAMSVTGRRLDKLWDAYRRAKARERHIRWMRNRERLYVR